MLSVGSYGDRAVPGDGWGGQQGRFIGRSQTLRAKVICAWVFFLNNFAYICHFIVCIYRRPYRKLIFVIVDLLILFT